MGEDSKHSVSLHLTKTSSGRQSPLSIPMTETHEKILKTKLAVLTKTMILDDIVDELISRGILTFDEKHQIYRNDASYRQQVERFIELLMRKPDSAFDELIEGLCNTGQSHVANELKTKVDIK